MSNDLFYSCREITFDNAEELTEEGLPFLILFHSPNDTKSVKDFKSIIKKEVAPERRELITFQTKKIHFYCSFINVIIFSIYFPDNFIFLTANGRRFAHPLQHMGKTQDDLPVIAIDSFRHMYMLPDFKHMYEEGRIKQFIQDLYSGKLHHEFHNGPGSFDPNKSNDASHTHTEHPADHADADPDASTLPESSFKKLAPSKNRYTLVRNEL